MRCRWCKRSFSQIEAKKMVTAHEQEDGSTAVNVPTESARATGPLLWAAHYKEYKEHDKREKRGGNAVGGGSLGESVPTAYEISESGVDTSVITDRQRLKREIAGELGLDSENWRVGEVMRARDHGGPYDHTHERPMESWKVGFHMTHAHGIAIASPQPLHDLEHVQMAKRNDPGHRDAPERDWHESEELEV